jgi:3-hydroxybutyryl-CoA dehydrogenase
MTELKSAKEPAVSALDKSISVGIVGAGTMGAGIAQLAATAGHPVLLYDAFDGAAAKGRERIARDLAKLVERGKMQSATVARLLERLTIASSLEDLAPAGLVVEAIVEDLDVKRKLFADLEKIVSPQALLATNTSSISVTAIARDLSQPGRFVGMHFFNPAPIMKLVEVISGVATTKQAAETVSETATAWGKVAVQAKSTPGFIVNRVARPFYAEALRLYEEGVADAATLDALMTEGAGFRMGPFTLMDLIGHDVNYAVSKSVFDAYYQEPRFRPSIVQLELVNAGRLGRKTGQGFFDYADGAEKSVPTDDQPASWDPVTDGDLRPGEAGEIDGVLVLPTHGPRAAEIAQSEDQPVIVFDYFDAAVTKRLAYAASADVAPAVRAKFAAILAHHGVLATHIPDWPGLFVARTIAMLANEGFEAVMQGVASEAAIDAAMLYGVNYPKGPIAWSREIGLKRILSILEHISAVTGDPRYRASLALRIAAEAA